MKNGIKINTIQAGEILMYMRGARDYIKTTKAVFSDSLLSNYMKNNTKLKVSKMKYTNDIINVKFDFGTYSVDEELDKLANLSLSEEEYQAKVKKINDNKQAYVKNTVDEVREILYTEGFDYNNIHYVMWFRSPAKARVGQVLFINEKLYDKVINWQRMGLELPKENAKIVEMSAYSSLTSSTIVDTVNINVDDILIVNDVDSIFMTNANIVYTDEKGQCKVKNEMAELKNVLWDGMALIESSLLGDKANGMALLRQHFFKACAFKANIQLFFKDYCEANNINYDNFKIKDMFGKWHYAKKIKMITTDNAIKWLKFKELMGKDPYKYWKDKVKADGCEFGIVKTDHISKLGDVQQMSYQMINSLCADKDTINRIATNSIEYVNSIKDDNDKFADFLVSNANEVNYYDMLNAMYQHNNNIANTKWFRYNKKNIISDYVKHLKRGNITTNADNLTVVSNPFALLNYAVNNNDYLNDTTLPIEEGTITCYTTRFADNEYLAGFRSPHNSPNNIIYLHNHYSKQMNKYFELSDNIIAVNSINTDIQARANGMDMDSDAMYVTNQEDIVALAKEYYIKYPTIVNAIEKSNKTYNNTLSDYAKMDNSLAEAKNSIGTSSNLAQLALSYYQYDNNNVDYYNTVIICSVLAQVSIDNAKRMYNVDLNSEIDRLSRLIPKEKPKFWKSIKTAKLDKNGKRKEIKTINNHICSMDYLELALKNIKNSSTKKGDNILDYVSDVEGRADKRQIDNIVNDISEYDNIIKYLNCIKNEQNDEEINERKIIETEETLEKLINKKISDKTLNKIIIMCLSDELDTYVANKLLNMLYKKNKRQFMKMFIM